MLQKLNWQANSGADRNKIIEDIKNCISINDAILSHFNMFSDLAMSLSIDIEENRIFDFHTSLAEFLDISEFNPVNINNDSIKEWRIYINVTFSSGKGNLKNEIPDVPG